MPELVAEFTLLALGSRGRRNALISRPHPPGQNQGRRDARRRAACLLAINNGREEDNHRESAAETLMKVVASGGSIEAATFQ